MFRGGSR